MPVTISNGPLTIVGAAATGVSGGGTKIVMDEVGGLSL